MANMTSSRVAQVNGAGDARALFLKIYGGEVLAAFNEHNVMAGRTMVRTIPSGELSCRS